MGRGLNCLSWLQDKGDSCNVAVIYIYIYIYISIQPEIVIPQKKFTVTITLQLIKTVQCSLHFLKENFFPKFDVDVILLVLFLLLLLLLLLTKEQNTLKYNV